MNPLFPLYPNGSFTQYNVSLSIPGPYLWDLPGVGSYAQKNNYPNSKVSILFPDIEYITKFVNYDLGISDGILSNSMSSNLAKFKSATSSGSLLFTNNFKSGSQEGMGFRSVEKTILASIFESNKPYFDVAQLVINDVVIVADIIARIAPLIAAAI